MRFSMRLNEPRRLTRMWAGNPKPRPHPAEWDLLRLRPKDPAAVRRLMWANRLLRLEVASDGINPVFVVAER